MAKTDERQAALDRLTMLTIELEQMIEKLDALYDRYADRIPN